MEREPFITGALSQWLDAIRLAAALCVLAGHAHQIGLYAGPWPFGIAFQQAAVIVFFVLSGLVITHSVDTSRSSAASYVAARVGRIVPVALAALAFSLAVAFWAASLGIAPEPVGADPGSISLSRMGLAAMFLIESYGDGLAIDPPYWSLCYEVWYYALFGAATYLSGGRRIAVLAAMALLAGPNILLLLPAWLAGIWLARSPRAQIESRLFAFAFVGLALEALYFTGMTQYLLEEPLHRVTWWFLGQSNYALGYLVLALFVTLGLIGLRRLVRERGALPAPLERLVKAGAAMSFTLYLFHWPLLVALKTAGLAPATSTAGFTALIAAICTACWAISLVTERRSKPLRLWLERALSRPATRPLPA